MIRLTDEGGQNLADHCASVTFKLVEASGNTGIQASVMLGRHHYDQIRDEERMRLRDRIPARRSLAVHTL